MRTVSHLCHTCLSHLFHTWIVIFQSPHHPIDMSPCSKNIKADNLGPTGTLVDIDGKKQKRNSCISCSPKFKHDNTQANRKKERERDYVTTAKTIKNISYANVPVDHFETTHMVDLFMGFKTRWIRSDFHVPRRVPEPAIGRASSWNILPTHEGSRRYIVYCFGRNIHILSYIDIN